MSQMTRQMIRLILACFLAANVSAVMAAQASVGLSMKAEKEIVVTDDNGGKTTKRIGVAVLDEHGDKSTHSIEAAVVPGDEVVYTIDYTNQSKDVTTDVVITNPIPEHMNYEDGSAKGENSRIEFSTDGKHFAAPEKLTVSTADGGSRPARAEDYTHVRWTLTAPLAPGKGGQVSYRAVLQ